MAYQVKIVHYQLISPITGGRLATEIQLREGVFVVGFIEGRDLDGNLIARRRKKAINYGIWHGEEGAKAAQTFADSITKKDLKDVKFED